MQNKERPIFSFVFTYTDIDDCSSSPCMHGVCLDEVNGYTCSCLSGYTGRICDIGKYCIIETLRESLVLLIYKILRNFLHQINVKQK